MGEQLTVPLRSAKTQPHHECVICTWPGAHIPEGTMDTLEVGVGAVMMCPIPAWAH